MWILDFNLLGAIVYLMTCSMFKHYLDTVNILQNLELLQKNED